MNTVLETKLRGRTVLFLGAHGWVWLFAGMARWMKQQFATRTVLICSSVEDKTIYDKLYPDSFDTLLLNRNPMEQFNKPIDDEAQITVLARSNEKRFGI